MASEDEVERLRLKLRRELEAGHRLSDRFFVFLFWLNVFLGPVGFLYALWLLWLRVR